MSPFQQQQHAHQPPSQQQNPQPDADGQYPPTDVKEEPVESDGESQQSDLTAGDYEDMIACSPGSSEGEEEVEEEKSQQEEEEEVENNNGGRGGKPSLPETENIDDDITQIEQDSFTSLMRQQPKNAPVRTRRLDKMSIRRYCTREGNHMYRCNVCSKTYTHISNFCRHFLSAHCGYKQDIHCPVCFKAFTRKDNMMTHAKQVHGVSVAKGPASEAVEHRDFTNN